MIAPKGRFTEARLKVQRAYQHIRNLEMSVKTFIDSRPCEVIVEEDPDTGRYLLKLISSTDLPDLFPLLIGDAAHNLRSSLDYVTTAIVRIGDNRVHFPIQERREELVSSPKLGLIERACPHIAEIILHKIKPYGAQHPLVALSRINNIDKHRFLTPTLTITALTGVDLIDENMNRWKGATLYVGAGGTLNAVDNSHRMIITNKGEPTGDIFFPQGGVLENQPVIPALMNLLQVVDQTIHTLELAHFGQVSEGD